MCEQLDFQAKPRLSYKLEGLSTKSENQRLSQAFMIAMFWLSQNASATAKITLSLGLTTITFP